MKRRFSLLNLSLIAFILLVCALPLYKNAGVIIAIFRLNQEAEKVLQNPDSSLCQHDTARVVDYLYRIRFGDKDSTPLTIDPQCENHPLASLHASLEKYRCEGRLLLTEDACKSRANQLLERSYFQLITQNRPRVSSVTSSSYLHFLATNAGNHLPVNDEYVQTLMNELERRHDSNLDVFQTLFAYKGNLLNSPLFAGDKHALAAEVTFYYEKIFAQEPVNDLIELWTLCHAESLLGSISRCNAQLVEGNALFGPDAKPFRHYLQAYVFEFKGKRENAIAELQKIVEEEGDQNLRMLTRPLRGMQNDPNYSQEKWQFPDIRMSYEFNGNLLLL